jgi:hypothetical protein
MDDQQFYEVVQKLLPTRSQRPSPGSEQLLHVDELRELINRSKEALKPKTAFLVVRTKYEHSVSYAAFKRFARQQGLSRVERKRMIRIELPPGLETQLDYGKVGTLQPQPPWLRQGVAEPHLLQGPPRKIRATAPATGGQSAYPLISS